MSAALSPAPSVIDCDSWHFAGWRSVCFARHSPRHRLKALKALLKVTKVDETDAVVTLRVEGDITAPLSSVLEAECLSYLGMPKALALDFSGVRLVDRDGARVVGRLRDRQVSVIGCWPLIEDEIRSLSTAHDI